MVGGGSDGQRVKVVSPRGHRDEDSGGLAKSIGGFFGFGKPKESAEARKKAEIARSDAEYQKHLKLAQEEDLDFLSETNMVYQSGCDLAGRPIIVVVAQRIPAKTVDNMLLLHYFMKILDPVVKQDYVIVYVHTGFRSGNQPPFSIFKKSYGLFSRAYKKNLKQVFLVQPTWWVKLIVKLFKPIISSKFYKKLIYIERVEELYKYMNRNQVKLPITLKNADDTLRYFSEPLDEVMSHTLNEGMEMPILVADAIRYLSARALRVQGIFRVSGNATRILEYKKKYDSGVAPNLLIEDSEHVIAGLLKLYVRELPDPLTTYELYDQWIECWVDKNPDQVLINVKKMLKKIPVCNRAILGALLPLLNCIAEHSEVNKMSVSNLAIVWSPNLFQNPDETPASAFRDMNITSSLVSFLIVHQAQLFE